MSVYFTLHHFLPASHDDADDDDDDDEAGDSARHSDHDDHQLRPRLLLTATVHSLSATQGGYIFYAGGSLAGAGYCRQSRRRPVILPLQL